MPISSPLCQLRRISRQRLSQLHLAGFTVYLAAALVILAVFPAGAAAQAAAATASPTAADRGAAAFVAGDWPTVAKEYATVHAANPQDITAKVRLAVAWTHLGRGREAFSLLEQAEKLGAPVAQVAFRQACVHAAVGELDAGFAALRRAIAAGFTQGQLLNSDPLLAPLRADGRWKEIETALDRVARPCMHDPKHREFDFWIGTWDVRPAGAPESQPPAENIVTLEHDGCVIQEHWRAPASNGQSFNLWDRSRGKWFQTWVDNSGGMHEYSGNLDANGNLVYFADLAAPPGQTGRIRTRLTFFPMGPDKVRQFAESTSDDGKTWTPVYDLIYLRRK